MITVLGDGSFGTAIASVLAYNGHDVKLWCHFPEIAKSINQNNINLKYFPEFKLDNKIVATTNIQEAIEDSEYIFQAIPVKFLRSVVDQSKKFANKKQVWISLSKGIEQNSLLFPTQVIHDVLGFDNVLALSGPSFAQEIMQKKFTGVDISSSDASVAQKVQNLLENDFFKTYFTYDLLGIQAAGAIKNAITLAIGIAQGAGYADNTKAFLLVAAIHEMEILFKKLGGKKESLFSLAGIGDLVLTTFGQKSRNLEIGKQIGQGQKLEEILKQTNAVPEGINTIQSIKQLQEKFSLNLPFFSGIYEIIFNGRSFESFLKDISS